MLEEDTIKIIKKAEKEAKRIASGKCDYKDMEFLLRRRVGRELGIGLWDEYFDNLTLYELAFEAYMYTAEFELQNGTSDVSKEELEEFIEKVKKKEAMAPPGFEDMFGEEKEDYTTEDIVMKGIS